MGHPLSQTLLTSRYIDRLLWPERKKLEEIRFSDQSRPETTENPMLQLVFRAYCLSLIKACDFVHQRICRETYYEVLAAKPLDHCGGADCPDRRKTMSQIFTTDLSSLTSTRKIFFLSWMKRQCSWTLDYHLFQKTIELLCRLG